MNEAAFSRAEAEAALLGRLGNPGKGKRLWGQWGCRGYVPAATLTAISKMQYLDPEELLMDEEDDVFGEGKHVFLAGAFLIDFA